MADILRIDAVLETEGAGAWVSAPEYGNDLPVAEDATFLLTRTTAGALSMAVRGYNGGEPLVGVTDSGSSNLGVQVGSKTYDAIRAFANLISVGDEERERYAEAIRLPEEPRNALLLHVLEQEKQGVWDLLNPAEYNDYDSAGQLVFISLGLVTHARGRFGEPDGDSSYAGFGGYKLDAPEPAKILKDGPEFKIVPHHEGSAYRGGVVSAIHERITSYPTRVIHAAEVTPEMIEAAEALVG